MSELCSIALIHFLHQVLPLCLVFLSVSHKFSFLGQYSCLFYPVLSTNILTIDYTEENNLTAKNTWNICLLFFLSIHLFLMSHACQFCFYKKVFIFLLCHSETFLSYFFFCDDIYMTVWYIFVKENIYLQSILFVNDVVYCTAWFAYFWVKWGSSVQQWIFIMFTFQIQSFWCFKKGIMYFCRWNVSSWKDLYMQWLLTFS